MKYRYSVVLLGVIVQATKFHVLRAGYRWECQP